MYKKALFFITLFTCWKLQAQDTIINQLQAQFIKEDIKIDGDLNKAVWKSATKITDFTQRELIEGTKPVKEPK